MTSRRSLKGDGARTSRAFQFIPGHVGGRVASAQPVRRIRTSGAMRQQPADSLTGAWFGKAYYEQVYDGVHGSAPPTFSWEAPSPAAGTFNDLPVVVFVSAGLYSTITPPAGWTTLLHYTAPVWGTIGVFTVNAYSGQAFTGFTNTGPRSPSGNFRTMPRTLVGNIPGSWSASLGTYDATKLKLTDPGAGHRLQLAWTLVRSDKTWSPTLPSTMANNGAYYEGSLINGSPYDLGGAWGGSGWMGQAQTDAMMKNQTIGVGDYTPSGDGECVPYTLRWNTY